MFKRLLYGIVAMTALFHSNVQAAPTVKKVAAKELTKGKYPCGVSADFFKSLGKTSPSGSSTAIITPASFPSAAIDTCGKFRVFYVDKAIGTGKGFDDPSRGVNRRNVVCAVLSYVQSVIDFSAIPSGKYIRFYIDTSYTSVHPAPMVTTFVARAGANYDATSTGVVNGWVHDFILSGTDPASLTDYHSIMKVNFDKVHIPDDTGAYVGDYKSVLFNDSLGAVGHCLIDFYSTILHEVTHTLGWSSMLPVFPSTTAATIYTSIDTAVHASSWSSSFATLKKDFSSGKLLYSPSGNYYWINGNKEPENYPIYQLTYGFLKSSWATSLSHLDDEVETYATKQHISPGDADEYVMSPFSRDGVTRRTFTKGEIQTLKNLFKYNLISSVGSSAIVTNHVPYSSKMSSAEYCALLTTDPTPAYHEKMRADTILKNDSGVVWKIKLTTDTTLKDADGDALRIYPNSLVNIRGAGIGGNNHNCLSVNAAGNEITFTPRHNFVGRCQIGFNLFDGKEKGGFVIYTCDVYRGNNVSAKAGDELVMNGDFEEGSEVKIRSINEGVNNTSIMAGRAGRVYGAYFADSHPFDYWAYPYEPYSGGIVIRHANADCDSIGILASGFGDGRNSFPNSKYGRNLPVGDIGDRYQALIPNSGSYYYLNDSLKSCKRYVLEMDVYSPSGSFGLSSLKVGFTDTNKLGYSSFSYLDSYTPKYNFQLKPDITFTLSSSWTHIKVPFVYCASASSDIMYILRDNINIEYHYDNISIKEDTNKLTVHIKDSVMLPCANRRLYAQTSHATLFSCVDTMGSSLKYTWTIGGVTFSSDSIIYVAPKVTTTYVVAVTDGCRTVKDSITLSPIAGLVVKARDTFMCSGDSVLMPITVSGVTGTATYSWTPTAGLSCSTCLTPKVAPTTTTTYTLTVTDSISCFKQNINIVVFPKPDMYVADVSICSSVRAELKVISTEPYTYYWADPTLSCDTCSVVTTPPLTTTKSYVVKATNKYGCSTYDTATVTVMPIPTITTIPIDTIICSGDSVTLSAFGGIAYSWTPSIAISCLTCSSTKVSPAVPGLSYEVTAINKFGCTNKASISIKVLTVPSLVALPSDTAICGTGYITLRASGASSYLWTPSAGVSSPTSAITTAFVSATTSYVVKGTDTSGCVKTDTVNVTVKPKPTVTVSSPFVNLCSGDSVVLNASGATSYLWTSSVTPSGIACPTCPSTKGKPATFPVTYTVTGTDTNGCSNTATVNANVVVCACTPSTVFGTSATTLTTATLPTTVSAGYYYLPNNLTISANTVMTGAKILIERGVTITVANSAKLTLDNCHLFTCDDDTAKGMWRGIVLASGATSGKIEVRNNCLIEDALYAIDANTIITPASGDVINVTNSTFNRNQVDITMSNYKASSPATLPITIKGNLFTARKFSRTTMAGYPNTWTSTNTLKDTTTVTDSKPNYFISKTAALSKAKCKDTSIFSLVGIRTTDIGVTSAAGVYQSQVLIGAGAAANDYNLFDNHQYGVTSFNCNISLIHNHFINISRRMIPDPSTTAPVGNGMAVILQSLPTLNTRAQVIPSTITGNLFNKFHDCYIGIYTEDVSTLTIQNAVITTSNTAGATVAGAAYPSESYAGYGMMIYGDGIQKSNTITGNTISNVNVGMALSTVNPKLGVTTNISNNFLYAANPNPSFAAYTGKQYMTNGMNIYGTGGVMSTDNTMTINNNVLTKVFNGISFQSLTNTKCSTTNNTITIWDTVTTVSGSSQYGIQANNTNEATISANVISNSIASLSADRIRGVLAASNTTLRICSNNTNNIGRGFEFASGASQTGTRWISNTMYNGYNGMVLASDIGDQGLTKDASMFPPYTYRATLNKWTGTWSTSASKNQTLGLASINTLSSKLWVKDIPSGTAERPSQNYAVPFPFIPYLYHYTGSTGSIRTTQLESNCSGIVSSIKANPFPYPLVGLGKTLGSLIMADSLGYDASFNVRQWMSQLSLYELGTNEPDLRDSSIQFNSFMTQASNSRFAWLTNIENAINHDDLTTAQNLLNNPVAAMGRVVVNGDVIITDYNDADNVVANYADYYTAFIHYLQRNMGYADSIRIQTIANKCPVKDGAVVYKARGLYQILSRQNVQYNDDGCEYSLSLNRTVQNGVISGGNNEYSLYPNPNNGIFTIKQNIVEDKLVSIRLYNALGQQFVQEKVQFKNGMANFKVENASAGLYLICLTDEQNKTVCLKFNIQ